MCFYISYDCSWNNINNTAIKQEQNSLNIGLLTLWTNDDWWLHSFKGSHNYPNSLFVLVHSPPAGSPERPTVAISPLRPQSSSPSRCPGQSGRPLSMVSPGSSLGPSPLSSPASRPLLPLSSPLSCLTPPNVSAVLLNGELASPLQPPLQGPSHAPTQGALALKVEKVSHILRNNCSVEH